MKPPSLGTEFSNEYLAELWKQGLSADEINKRLWRDLFCLNTSERRREVRRRRACPR
jgi:hypothetical protein